MAKSTCTAAARRAAQRHCTGTTSSCKAPGSAQHARCSAPGLYLQTASAPSASAKRLSTVHHIKFICESVASRLPLYLCLQVLQQQRHLLLEYAAGVGRHSSGDGQQWLDCKHVLHTAAAGRAGRHLRQQRSTQKQVLATIRQRRCKRVSQLGSLSAGSCRYLLQQAPLLQLQRGLTQTTNARLHHAP